MGFEPTERVNPIHRFSKASIHLLCDHSNSHSSMERQDKCICIFISALQKWL